MSATPVPASRSSVACLLCRSRHIKCDSQKPRCSRCNSEDQPCHYPKSRRGGLDRAALAERRRRIAAKVEEQRNEVPQQDQATAPAGSISVLGLGYNETQDLSTTNTINIEKLATATLGDWPEDFILNIPGHITDTITTSTEETHSLVSSVSDTYKIETDPLFGSYFAKFHKLHPVILPRKHFLKLYQDSNRKPALTPLVAIIRLIGYLYESHKWSQPLQDAVETCFLNADLSDPFMVQSRLLYSIALFWYKCQPEYETQIKEATKLAIDLQMFTQEFAAAHGAGDPTLEECWRRTWWTLYLLHGYYAGTLGTMNFELLDIIPTVDLPCEEEEYELGNIPKPLTLEDFDCREFASEDVIFSSFAYLIGALRAAANAILSAPKIPCLSAANEIIQTADPMLDAWLLLLPRKAKRVMSSTGEIDELLFQAELLIHVANIGLHRPYSDLKFNSIEHASSCARQCPPEVPIADFVNVHTVRCLRSVQAQIRLLALPCRPFHHTPFVTCMISEGTLSLLSSCNYILQGKELTVARDQIRMTIGCLREIGEIWPRTAKNVKEIQSIAKHLFGLTIKSPNSDWSNMNQYKKSSTTTVDADNETPDDERQAAIQIEQGLSREGLLSSVDAINSSIGWYDLDNLDPGFLYDSR